MGSSQISKSIEPISASRITYRSPTPFSTVESRLQASIVGDRETKTWPSIASAAIQKQSATHAEKVEYFASLVNDHVGPHGFMKFFEANHGMWLSNFYPNTVQTTDGRMLQSKRIILGNPLIAVTMLKHDLDAGLYLPVELLLVEEEDGGTRCIYQLPSGLVAGYVGAKEELKRAAEVLDGKLEVLVKHVMDCNAKI
jgi:Domain of unknown function DUF302